MRFTFIGLFCAVLMLSMPSAAAPAPPNTTTNTAGKTLSPFGQKLVENEQAFLAAAERGDVAYVKKAVAEDYSAIGSNGADDDYNDLLEGVRSAAKEKAGDAKDQPIRYFFEVVQLDDDCAVVSYNTVNAGGHPRYLHTSDTWVKNGDQWKLKFRQSTPNVWSATDID